MKTLEELYEEASKFVEAVWPDTKPNQKRISILSAMKMLIELERMKKKE